ncbi:MAC/perforin domain-containing protein [Agrobacterium genomosp. 13]|uniref:Ricin B lectin domain-containing protein n=1 Tax=Agrobacterium genomosp. 13 str. CFBP 6927 TaxID=1183428 RepID=A0ABP2BKD4_9HYPH|nr:MAC/perforin domain-containing protein [Agrobacterium genomosp. 13]CUX47306.1 hypothetical protein AGR13a_Lc100197 [Agrobacterium genomosp. 13 str. CFBP 6927]
MSDGDEKGSRHNDFDSRYAALGERSREHVIRRTELELNEASKELQAREAQLKKEAADDRAAILAAVRTTTPDLTSRLVEKMDELGVKDHEFTERDKTTLMNLANLQLADSQDFFDLNSAQRDDLLDRVGFYRGISISTDSANQVQVGFRDVLKRSDERGASQGNPSKDALLQDLSVNVAKPLYRKPAFAGYFENYFTFSEAVHQNQKNGVTNLKFSLSASAGLAVRGGVGVGAAYGQQNQTNDGSVGKEVFITSNFFLPRIELSFDDREPCASNEFISACQDAVKNYDSADGKFTALKRVLEKFGHFVPTMTLIGGRLFATESKKYDGLQTTRNATERFAASVKANLKTVSANVESEVSAERSEQIQSDDKSKDESQSSTFHAMGGEGGLVQDAAGWIRSLSDYRRWSAVQRENLIPSIDVLPLDLKKDCWSVLKTFVAMRTKRELLFDEDAAFVFYGDYASELEDLAVETWFVAQNEAHLTAMTISDSSLTDGVAIGLAPVEPLDLQTWRISPDGHLIAYVTRTNKLRGRGRTEFAVSLDDFDMKKPPAQIPVVLRQLNQTEHQVWDYTGAGTFQCATVKGNYVLAVNEKQQLVAMPRSTTVRRSEVWDLTEVSPATLKKSATAAAATRIAGWFKLRAGNNAHVLSIRNAEDGNLQTAADGGAVVMLPDISGAHQLWMMTDEGQLVSRIDAADGGIRNRLLLTVGSDDVLSVKTKAAGEHQRWALTSEGFLKSVTRPDKIATAGGSERISRLAYSISLQDQTSGSRQRWSALQHENTDKNALVLTCPKDGTVHNHKIYSFASISLPVFGKIRGMRLNAYNRGVGRDGWGLRCELFVKRESSSDCRWISVDRDLDEDNSEEVSYIWSDKKKGDCYFEQALLYLPSDDLTEFRFAFAPGSSVLTPMYRTAAKSDWIFSDPSDYASSSSADDVVVSDQAVIADDEKTVVAIGLHWDRRANFLMPKLLTR